MPNRRPETSLRNVLIVSYYFPPSGGPGVQRVLKFLRYLPEFGYRGIVLTVPESAAFPARDPSLLDEVPAECLVFRAPLLEFYGLYKLLMRSRDSDVPVNLVVSSPRGGTRKERLLRRLRGAIFVPDGRVGWLPAGTRIGRKICRTEAVDLIFASGPPFTAHWIARRISEASGLPLVLDFRDPWTRSPFYPSRPGFARRLDERLERNCLLRSSRVVTVNQDIRSDFLARVPELQASRIEVIENGFDPQDFAGKERNPARVWTLAHTGTVPPEPFLASFLPALESLAREEPNLVCEMRIRMAGIVDPSIEEALRRHPLGPAVRLEGYLSHRDSVQALLDSHLLLVFMEDEPRAKGIEKGDAVCED